MAGLNVRFDIWRMEDSGTDDYVGGASVTGTIVYQYIQGRFQGFMPDQVFEQQGLETLRTFKFLFSPGTLDIRERDEAQLVAPFDHPHYNHRFRLTGIRYSDFNPRDPRNYMTAVGTRSVRAHTQQ